MSSNWYKKLHLQNDNQPTIIQHEMYLCHSLFVNSCQFVKRLADMNQSVYKQARLFIKQQTVYDQASPFINSLISLRQFINRLVHLQNSLKTLVDLFTGYRVFKLDMTYFEVPDGQLKLASKLKKLQQLGHLSFINLFQKK